MKASCKKHLLNFKHPSGTSRGVLKAKETWFIILHDKNNYGVGECGILRGLSIDDLPDYEEKLKWVCSHIYLGLEALYRQLTNFPSIQFGLEQAFLSLKKKTPFELFPSKFTLGQEAIPINGLVWMGSKEFMKNQISEKLNAGFTCIKMKIGAIDFNTELALIASIRKEFTANEIEIRVDANGAFSPKNALVKLSRLADLELHSIEQPIAVGQLDEMASLCEQTPLPIALDEELIGVFDVAEKLALIQSVQPQYIILKPSFIGGFQGASEWIKIANEHNIDWWITSALESNIGLNAISQWTYTLHNTLPQGLGTGSLFSNNIQSPLHVHHGKLMYNPEIKWDYNGEGL